jgi:hypothetical protein
MRRPIVRFLLTLLAATSILGIVPATSEAGIIPWAWDTMFGPVGSIQARRYGGGYNDCGTCGTSTAGCCYGPSPRLVGFRGWRRRACCGTVGYGSYYGGYGGNCCSSCGGCDTGCSSCGTGCSTYDGGYASGYGSGGCGPGGCASGQCNVNYPPGTTGTTSPVTPAPPPAPPGGPSPYDSTTGNNSATGAQGAPGFQPRGSNSKGPAPATGDPTKEGEYIPPKVNNTDSTNGGAEAGGSTGVTPPVPGGSTKTKPTIGEDDDKEGNLGPRLELEEKITWRRTIVRTRQAQAPARVSASANRFGMFPKVAWRSGVETELAKK